MGKKSSDKQRKSLFYKILVLVILLAFSVFLYCAEQDVTPVEALQYLLGQTELDQLPDMPAITDIPHLEELEEWLPEDSPSPSKSASPTPLPQGTADAGSDPGIQQTSGMHAYILDVGQGSCAFIRSPGGYTMLIDAAESQYYPVIEEFLQEQGVERLDVVVASHPHSDHIGAMAKVIQNFEIGAFYLPDKPHTTATYERMIQALEDKEVAVYPAAGSKDAAIAWDPLVTASILSPVEGVSYDDLNNVSAVIRLSYGDTSILFPGDAEDEAQEIMLSKLPLSCFPSSVLVIAHHGSSNASSDPFLQAVDPSLAVISVGEGNDYGHPHQEVLDKLERMGIPYYRTDENGTVHILLNGKKVQVETQR